MTPSIAFHTFGCKVNQYETEELREQFRLGGYRVVPGSQPADIAIVNSCTVTSGADRSCRQLIRKLLRELKGSRVVVTGCYAERAAEELRQISPRVEVYGNHEKPMIAIALGVPTACVQEAARSGVTALADRTRAYIKIQDGCDAKCTYCIIPSVRPNLICRSPERIRAEASNLIDKGFREIVLTGVRLGRYQYGGTDDSISSPRRTPALQTPGGPGRRTCGDPGSIMMDSGFRRNDVKFLQQQWTFERLLKALLELPGDFRIRLSSLEVTEIPDELVMLAARHPKLCPFFHIPLQSGDDAVLKRMGRWYSSQDYRDRVRWIKSRIPEVALSADIIVGFAGEGETEFQRTLQLLEEEGLSRIHAFRYSVRPGTPAQRLSGHVDPRVKAQRTRTMVALDRTLRRRYAEMFVGRSVRLLVESDGTGYTERYVRARAPEGAREGEFIDCIYPPEGIDLIYD